MNVKSPGFAYGLLPGLLMAAALAAACSEDKATDPDGGGKAETAGSDSTDSGVEEACLSETCRAAVREACAKACVAVVDFLEGCQCLTPAEATKYRPFCVAGSYDRVAQPEDCARGQALTLFSCDKVNEYLTGQSLTCADVIEMLQSADGGTVTPPEVEPVPDAGTGEGPDSAGADAGNP